MRVQPNARTGFPVFRPVLAPKANEGPPGERSGRFLHCFDADLRLAAPRLQFRCELRAGYCASN
jgi:hypothetical protein